MVSHGVRGRDSEDRRGGASLTCPEWETNILACSLYFYCIFYCISIVLCLVFVYCINPSRIGTKYASSIVILLYIYCAGALYLCIVLYLCLPF